MSARDQLDGVKRADEKEVLVAFLAFHQDALVRKVEGVSETDGRRSPVPSRTSLFGLLKHVAYVHSSWFELCFSDRDPSPDLPWPTDPEVAADDETLAVLLDRYEAEVARCREIVVDAALDDRNRGWRGGAYQPDTYTLRWILVHMIEEMARHNGHADILREQVDGATGQ